MPKRDIIKSAPRHRFVALNKLTITGHCTHDPQIRYGDNGEAVCMFQIGVSRPMRGTSGRRRNGFFQVATFGQLALQCANLRTGLPVLVEGELQETQWQVAGRWVRGAKIVADRVWRMTEDEADTGNTLAVDESLEKGQTKTGRRKSTC